MTFVLKKLAYALLVMLLVSVVTFVGLHLAPGDVTRHETFAEHIKKMGPKRDDIRTMFDRLELDDYYSFGGKA